MKLLKFTFCVLLCFAAVKASEKARFDNYRVYEIYIENDQQLELMQHIENYPDGVRKFPANFWVCLIKK